MDFVTFVTTTSVAFIAVSSLVVLGLVEVVKKTGLNRRYAPLVSVIFGVTIGFFYGGFESTSYNVLAGFLSGLTACGAYAGVKKTIK